MIRHIIMWTLKEHAAGADKKTNAARMKVMLESLPGRIPSICGLEVGTDVFGAEPACDAVLCAEFASRADLDAYLIHPEHLRVVAFIKEATETRRVVDYEV